MDESQSNPDRQRNVNIWAPWRIEYIESLATDHGCFLCDIRDNPSDDERNLVIWRGRRAVTVMNRFPYTGGHCLIAPQDHLPDLDGTDGETILEMMAMVRDIQKAIAGAIGAQGFNVGMNIGRCAGAGLPGHLHIHVVPRWAGDTNFMSVFGDVRVIPDALSNLRVKILAAAGKLGLPKEPPDGN